MGLVFVSPGGVVGGGGPAPVVPIDPATLFQANDAGVYFDVTDTTTLSRNASGTPRDNYGSAGGFLEFIENQAANVGNPFSGQNANVQIPSVAQQSRFDNELQIGFDRSGITSRVPSLPGSLRTPAVALAEQSVMTMIVCFTNDVNPGAPNNPRHIWGFVDANPGAGGSQVDSFAIRLNQNNGSIVLRGENAERATGAFFISDPVLTVENQPVVYTFVLDANTSLGQGFRDGVQFATDVAITPSNNTDMTWAGTNNSWSFGITTDGFSSMLTDATVHAAFGIDRILSTAQRRGAEEWMAQLANHTTV